MHRVWVDRMFRLAALVWAVAVLLLVASASNAVPAPQDSPAPPAPASTPAPEVTPVPEATPAPSPAPRIIRTVCTDHVCGGCDGKCRKSSGHVAVDKKGHCACTPTDGGDLDRAVRQAYERRPPQ